MQPTFVPPQNGYAALLKCPACGHTDIHHDRIEIFERGEDSETGVHVTVTEGSAVMDTNLAGNPSVRRHGFKVHFWCEACPAKSVLAVSQHKGVTEVDISY